jgi:hypothetical protein
MTSLGKSLWKKGVHTWAKEPKDPRICAKEPPLTSNVKAVKRVEGAKRSLTRMDKGTGIDDVTH